MQLETSRLVLKILEIEDAAKVIDFYSNNKLFFQPWSPIYPIDFYTLEFHSSRLQTKKQEFLENKSLNLYLFPKEKPQNIIGEIEFSNIIFGPFQSCYLGYKMDKAYIQKGLMKEALRSAILYVFDVIKLHRIEANVMPKNSASIKLLESLGFEQEGLAKNYLKINGKWEDHIHFAFRNLNLE